MIKSNPTIKKVIEEYARNGHDLDSALETIVPDRKRRAIYKEWIENGEKVSDGGEDPQGEETRHT
jgi:hypothetical protein